MEYYTMIEKRAKKQKRMRMAYDAFLWVLAGMSIYYLIITFIDNM